MPSFPRKRESSVGWPKVAGSPLARGRRALLDIYDQLDEQNSRRPNSYLPARSPVRKKCLALDEDSCRAQTANRTVQTRINGLDCRVLGREYLVAAESIQVAATLQHPHHRRLQVAEVKRAATVLLSLRFPHEQLGARNVDEI